MKLKSSKHYVICVRNEGYEVSLERRKIYRVIPDKKAAERQLFKVVDESGQSYLYPQSCFVAIALTQPIRRALDRAA